VRTQTCARSTNARGCDPHGRPRARTPAAAGFSGCPLDGPGALELNLSAVPPSQFPARLIENRALTGGYFVLELEVDGVEPGASPLASVDPGQFVMLRGDWGRELLNPRAFSILDADADGRFSVMLKAYGRGTRRMQAMRPGDAMMVTGPLGRGFAPPPGPSDPRQILVAGGVGLPPLHLQARRAAARGRAEHIELIYGGRDADDLVMLDDFDRWNIRSRFATEDGSRGVQGFVTLPLLERVCEAARAREAIVVLACGPTPMLRAVRRLVLEHGVPAQLCLEEEMACGFGVCLGCAVPVHGPKPYRYCCTDGPVFDATEVRWA
jgi:dihydroorotate dehydrogenase electron transfer subunit